MLPQSFLVLISALAAASAGPAKRRACASVLPSSSADATASPTLTVSSAASSSSAATPSLPLTGVTPELPAANGTLLYIGLGHGIQNYTCSATGANATSAGALAVLYDITALYPTLTDAQQKQLSVDILHQAAVPLNMASSANNSDVGHQYAADPAAPFQGSEDAAVTLPGVAGPLAALGRHYFDAVLTPTFDLYAAATAGTLFKGGKLANVHAPADADPGLLNTGAVDWLQLGDKGASVGLTEVYRVITAGGNGLNCTTADQTFSVPYSAQYWFYNLQS